MKIRYRLKKLDVLSGELNIHQTPAHSSVNHNWHNWQHKPPPTPVVPVSQIHGPDQNLCNNARTQIRAITQAKKSGYVIGTKVVSEKDIQNFGTCLPNDRIGKIIGYNVKIPVDHGTGPFPYLLIAFDTASGRVVTRGFMGSYRIYHDPSSTNSVRDMEDDIPY